MKNLRPLNLLVSISIILLASCVPKDEFLPRDVQQMGAKGLRQKKIEEEKLKKTQKDEDLKNNQDKGVVIDGPIGSPPGVDDIFSTVSKNLSFDDSVMTDGNQLKKWYVDGHRKTEEELIKPTNIKKLYFYFYGEFLAGDHLYIYPDFSCSIAPDRTTWTTPVVFQISQNDFEKFLSLEEGQNPTLPIAGVPAMGVNFEIDGTILEDGIFYPTVRFERNGIKSNCYSFIDSSTKMQKDSIIPSPPILSVINPVSDFGPVQLQVRGNQTGVNKIKFYPNENCLADPFKEIKLFSQLTPQFNVHLNIKNFVGKNVGELANFKLSAMYEDKAGNKSACSNSVAYSQMKPPFIEIFDDENKLFKTSIGPYFSSTKNLKLKSQGINNGQKVYFYKNGDCSNIIGTVTVQADLNAIIDYEIPENEKDKCTINSPCKFSTGIKYNGQSVCTSEPAQLIYDENGPKVWLSEVDGIQYLKEADLNKDSPQNYEIFLGRASQGIHVNVMDDLDWYLGTSELLTIKYYENPECTSEIFNTSLERKIDGVGLSFNDPLIISPIDQDKANLFHQLYFKIFDSIGNGSNCVTINQAIFEEDVIKINSAVYNWDFEGEVFKIFDHYVLNQNQLKLVTYQASQLKEITKDQANIFINNNFTFVLELNNGFVLKSVDDYIIKEDFILRKKIYEVSLYNGIGCQSNNLLGRGIPLMKNGFILIGDPFSGGPGTQYMNLNIDDNDYIINHTKKSVEQMVTKKIGNSRAFSIQIVHPFANSICLNNLIIPNLGAVEDTPFMGGTEILFNMVPPENCSIKNSNNDSISSMQVMGDEHIVHSNCSKIRVGINNYQPEKSIVSNMVAYEYDDSHQPQNCQNYLENEWNNPPISRSKKSIFHHSIISKDLINFAQMINFPDLTQYDLDGVDVTLTVGGKYAICTRLIAPDEVLQIEPIILELQEINP